MDIEKIKIKLRRIKRNVWIVVGVIGFVGAVGASVLVQKQISLKTKAGQGPAVLVVTPSTKDISIGEEDTIQVSLNPNGANVSGVELVMTYDSNVIEVSSISVGGFFTSDFGSPVEIVKDISTPGKIHYAVGFPLGSNYSSTSVGDVAIIAFSGKVSGSSTFSFVSDTSIQPHTIVSNNQGQDVLDNGMAGTIIVSGGARLYFDSLTPVNPQVVGNPFSVKVMVDTAGQGIDGVDAKITFDPSVLTVTDLDQGTETGFTSYPALTYDNSAGTVTISTNIGSGASPATVNGSTVHVGTVFFSPKAVTAGTNVTFDYTAGGRNDSNIVLSDSVDSSDPTDILSSVDTLTIIAQATAPTATPIPTVAPTATPTAVPTVPPATPTSAPGTTATPTVAPTATATPEATATSTATPQSSQSVTVKIRFQGRLRLNASNAKSISLSYRLASGTSVSSVIATTSTDGEFTLTFVPGTYSFLIDAPGYLARKIDNVNIVAGNLNLDLSSAILRGGDFNDDGEVNEVDYTVGFIPNFGTSNATVDLDGSEQVNNLDFSIMRNNWNLINDVLQ